jgi:hypothetical protein
VISPAAILGYNTGGAVLTLVLPLGFFIIVMAAFSLIFTRPHTVPGHRDSVKPARPVPPPAGTAHGLAAAAGLPIAPSGGGPAPLTDRDTPPVVGAAKEAVEEVVDEVKDAVTGDSGKDGTASTEGPASTEGTSSSESKGDSE